MKTKSQILKDNGLDLRSTSVDDLRAISFAMDEYAKQSHVAERIKIVVPSELGGMTNYRDGWNACLKSIRTLNPGAEVVEVDKNETK